jgi:predicted enzyme involved in methoxymalonyl-ACP biosynthesis
MTVSYEDRLGPLGTICVASGRIEDDVAILQTWVLSCRAFARYIEHVVLEALRDKLGVRRLDIDYVRTEKNKPLQTFLQEIGAVLPHEAGAVTVPDFPPTPLHERIFREPR